MAEKKGKKPTLPENDDETPSEKSAPAEPADAESRKAVDKRPPGKAAKGRPASARHDDEDDEDEDEDDDEDDEDEDEDDEDDEDEEEEEEEEVKAPPPKRPATSKSKPVRAKAAPVAQKKGQGSVYRKPAPRAPVVPRKPARHYVPYVGLGLLVVAGSVWVDVAYRPVACLGIAIIIWAYLQIGSANEIIPGQR